MTISHNGTLVSSCDTAGDFTTRNSGANIDTEDPFYEGTGAIGDKMSGTNELLVSDNLSGGAAGVYDFAVAGADEGKHILCHFLAKNLLVNPGGMQIYVRNATGHNGQWYVDPIGPYSGGFLPRVIDPTRDFDTAVTWTLAGNPAQLDDVSELGCEYDVSGSIMGSFNNIQADSFSVGFGLRAASNQFTFGTTSGVTGGATDTIDATTHGWPDGTPVHYSKAGGSVDIGLTDDTIYYINAATVSTVTMHLTRAAAIAGTGQIDLTATGAETHELTPAYAMEDVAVFDEDLNQLSWWTRSQGAFIGRGKLSIGPATGSAVSRFNDSAFTVIFAEELVAADFYEINVRGGGTICNWSLGSISAATPSVARWTLTIESDTSEFTDENGVWVGAATLDLDDSVTLTGTTLIDCTVLNLLGGTLTGINVLDANTADGAAFVITNTLANISDCTFAFSDGHAIEINTAGTYTFSGNIFDVNFGGTPGSNLIGNSGSTDAMIVNTSNGEVIINVEDSGTTPSIRNVGASSSTTVNNNTSVTFTNLRDNTEIRVYDAGTGVEIDGIENAREGVETLVLHDNMSEAVSTNKNGTSPTPQNDPGDSWQDAGGTTSLITDGAGLGTFEGATVNIRVDSGEQDPVIEADITWDASDTGTGDVVMIIARSDDANSNDGYSLYFRLQNTNWLRLQRWNAGSFTEIVAAFDPTPIITKPTIGSTFTAKLRVSTNSKGNPEIEAWIDGVKVDWEDGSGTIYEDTSVDKILGDSAHTFAKIRATNMSTLSGIADFKVYAQPFDARTWTFSDLPGNIVNYVIHNWKDDVPVYETIRLNGYTIPTVTTSIAVQQRRDRNTDNG